MMQGHTIRRTIAQVGISAALSCALLGASAFGQVSSYGDKETGENSGNQLPTVLEKVEVQQHLNQQLPLEPYELDGETLARRSGWAIISASIPPS